MKIAFVVYRFPALSETFILNQITGLLHRGHEVDIYSERSSGGEALHLNVKKYNLIKKTNYLPKLPYNPKSRKKTVINYLKLFLLACLMCIREPWFLLKIISSPPYTFDSFFLKLLCTRMPSIRENQYDIVHCHFAYMGTTGLIIRQISNPKARLITTFHGHDVNVSDKQAAIDKYKWIFKRGDLFTANTTFTANQAVELGCPRERIIKLPVGLKLSKYRLKKNQFPADGKIKILTVARLVEKKGIEYSIKAVARALEEYSNLEYLIVGDGCLRTKLQQLVNKLEIAEKIQFLGWKTQEEIINLYQQSHIFILASVTATNGDKEGQGLVLQEAQAIGLPILSTIHNGIPDGVRDGKSGFLVPEKDVEALTTKLLYLIQNPELWSEIGKAGRNHIENNYNIEQLNNRLETIYKDSNSCVKKKYPSLLSFRLKQLKI